MKFETMSRWAFNGTWHAMMGALVRGSLCVNVAILGPGKAA